MRSIARAVALGSVMLLVTGPAMAGFKNGNQLFEYCKQPEDTLHGSICVGYIEAVSDAMESHSLGLFRACIPQEATVGKVKDVVEQWLGMHPQERHLSAWSLVAKTLAEGFPCKT